MLDTYTEVDAIDVDKMDEEINEELKTNVTVAIQTEVLKKLIGKVERSVSKKSVQDIYRFIYLDFQPNRITARGINNFYMTEAIVEQSEDQTNFKLVEGKPGSICLPADKLIPIVKHLNAKNSSITITSNNALFKSGRPEFNLHGIDGSEFPQTPELANSLSSVSIHPNVLSMMYDRTMYAASTKETRPTLTGVYHKVEENRLQCTSTDSHRLAQFVYDLDGDHLDVNLIIPVTVLAEAKKHLDATEKEVTLHFYEGQVVYEFDNVTLYARILEGVYPNVASLIFDSEQAGSTFVVHVGNFKNLLANSTVYNPDQPIIIRIKPELNQLRVNTREAEVGAFQEDLAITEGSGTDVVLAVNVRYLQEAFARYNNDDYVKFEFMPSTPQKPAGMQPFKGLLHNGNPDCLELFVPVRTSQVDYQEVVIDDFQGVPEFEFNPFEMDFAEVE